MALVKQNWTCPYCGRAQVLSQERCDEQVNKLRISGEQSRQELVLGSTAIICANDACRRLTLSAFLGHPVSYGSTIVHRDEVWSLLPASSAKPQPDFIPEPIRKDYYEACAIRDLSPKASATITRRCLQGMIRDFCKISKHRLIDEIVELRALVAAGKAPQGVLPDTVEAIDDVRKIGNIGAHMEADINVIVDVDPDEAQVLIELVETLFEEWYVAAEDRKTRLGHLKSIATAKQQQKKDNSA